MSNQKIVKTVAQVFSSHFSQEPLLIRAPGRINLIGEHTDYNEGFVLPAAVDKAIYFAMSRSGKDQCTIISLDQKATVQVDINHLTPSTDHTWMNYITGVAYFIRHAGHSINGFNVVFGGDIPLGAGMSSSAALECGICFGLNELFDLGLDRKTMALIGQRAEHEFVGVKCGIMDQFSSLMGKKSHVFRLDCRSLAYDYFPIELGDYELLLINSNVHHSLASSEYNVRRTQCEEGVAIISKKFSTVKSLRDVDLQMLQVCKEDLDEIIYRRCKYVVEENMRVESMAKALKNEDLTSTGKILKTAQQAMMTEYEITCPEIDFLADFANQDERVLGARMMGGGFGGCTLNLVAKAGSSSFTKEILEAYLIKFGLEGKVIPVVIDEGVCLVNH